MNWTQLLKDAGIPDSPGRAEVVRQSAESRQRAARAEWAREKEALADHMRKLAAQGDTRKAIRSKVRVG
jgi:hypothetical protein